MFGIPEKSFDLIITALHQFPEIEKAIIFGSRSMGNYKAGSDIDIAIVGDAITPDVVLKLKAALNEQLPLPYYFDVVDYTHLENSNLRQHIETEGTLFYLAG